MSTIASLFQRRASLVLVQHRSKVRCAGGPMRKFETCMGIFGSLDAHRFQSSARPLSHDEAEEEEDYSRPPPSRQTVKKLNGRRPLSPILTKKANPDAEKKNMEVTATIPEVSPTTIKYTGDTHIPITTRLLLIRPDDDVPKGVWPVFRMMDESGEFRNPATDLDVNAYSQAAPQVSQLTSPLPLHGDLDALRQFLIQKYPYQAEEIEQSGLLHASERPYADTNSTNTLLRAHRLLIRLREMDAMLLHAQRQGRISFYMACTGEEAIHHGAASALDSGDHIFAQYREQGLLMWRGFTLEQFTNQCFANDLDLGKGRQMPVHYGSRALNYHTVSSPLGTQLPQAVGAAYRLKLMGKPNIAIAFFGDGCASTTDFHAALNFAATLSSPVIFFCRNNGYAISTSVSDQYQGDGIVSRAPGYGMAAIRVDGNDMFAVHAAVREARRYALANNEPVLIEGMTYRLGHHSTSDDSTRYRSEQEIQDFSNRLDPLQRLNSFLERIGYLTEDDVKSIKAEERANVLKAIQVAEKRPKPSMETMFDDVYKDKPKHLEEQLANLKDHLSKYPDKY